MCSLKEKKLIKILEASAVGNFRPAGNMMVGHNFGRVSLLIQDTKEDTMEISFCRNDALYLRDILNEILEHLNREEETND